MGSKNNPGEFDCYANAMPDEPMFVLLARDPDFYPSVMKWAERRRQAIADGRKPESDMRLVEEARACAFAGLQWRHANDGQWRKVQT